MANKHSTSGSRLAAWGFLLTLLILTLSTVYFFWERTWWFPESITSLGHQIDAQFVRTLWITGLVFVLAQLGLAYTIFRYRADVPGRAVYSHGHTGMEIIWTSLTAILFVGLGVVAEAAWREYHALGPTMAANAQQVEITGKQFKWYFRYPGPDGQFGRTDPTLVNDQLGNYQGVDFTDPAAKDDVITAELAVIVNQPVNVTLRSLDVTHSFFVRELRFKQDAVPGLLIRMNFTAEKAGGYEIACAELCGLGHHQMRADLRVLNTAEFDTWMREQAAYMPALTGEEEEPPAEQPNP
ncbi:MAG TPA: cytochrome c oxidase subunit II [Candidatus Acidoferrales bacterium]|nr:cytochrome c oxidase subunit II [Candidatus Acidoferrales bacterium]